MEVNVKHGRSKWGTYYVTISVTQGNVIDKCTICESTAKQAWKRAYRAYRAYTNK